jgi:hypothetical protein
MYVAAELTENDEVVGPVKRITLDAEPWFEQAYDEAQGRPLTPCLDDEGSEIPATLIDFVPRQVE